MRRLLLIRHGLTEWNEAGRLMGRMPIGLAPRGEAQIRKLAAALADERIDSILCSPQQRTRETAAIVAAPHRIEVGIEEALDEVWLGPRWQGKTYDEIRDDQDFLALRRNPTYECSDIEPIKQVQERVVELVERVRTRGAGHTVALVSHGDPLRVLLAHFLNVSLADYRRFVVETGSLSVVAVQQKMPRVLLLSWKPGQKLSDVLP
jgi:broad specificity phosphatase PhoE